MWGYAVAVGSRNCSRVNADHIVTTNPSGFILESDFNLLREGLR